MNERSQDTGHHDPSEPVTATQPDGSERPASGAGVTPVGWMASLAVLIALAVAFAGGRASVPAPVEPASGPRIVGAADGRDKAAAPALGAPGGAESRMTADARWYPYGGRVLLQAGPSLPDVPTTADGWVIAGHRAGDRVLEALREITGATSPTRDEYGQLSVNDPDGTSLWVGSDPMGSFGAYVAARSPWNCAQSVPGFSPDGAPATREASVSGGTEMNETDAIETKPAPAPCPAASGVKPTTARELALAAFRTLGLPTDTTRIAVTDQEASVTVTAELLLDGQPSGLQWSAEVSSKGVFSLYGFTASPRRVSDYPVVGAATAVQRSNDPRFQQFGPIFLGPWDAVPAAEVAKGAAGATSGAAAAPDAPVATNVERPAPGDAPDVPQLEGRPVLLAQLDEVTVTTAELGLSQFSLSDGSVALLPVWVLSSADGRSWSMLAVDDRYIRFTASGR